MKYVKTLGVALLPLAALAQSNYTGPIPKLSQPQVNGRAYVGEPPRGGTYTGRTARANEPSIDGRPIVSPSEYERAYRPRDAQPEGHMVGGTYVAPSWAEHVDWLLRQR